MAPISIMTATELELSLKRIASEMMEACAAEESVALIGVLTRGEPLARRLAGHIEEMEGISPPLGALDIGVHRDDGGHPTEGRGFEPTLIDFDLTGRGVFLVDDVFFTGRTARARYGSPPLSTGATGSSRSAPISSARTCPPRLPSASGCGCARSTARTACGWRSDEGNCRVAKKLFNPVR